VNVVREPKVRLDNAAREFLAASGWAEASCQPLTGDASVRKYFRLRNGKQSAVLMDASRSLESVAPFMRLDRHLAQLGFSVPAILSHGAGTGLLLLEDFGDDTFVRLLERQREGKSQGLLPDSHPRRRSADRNRNDARSDYEDEEAARRTAWAEPERLYTLGTDVLAALHEHPQAIPEGLRTYHPGKMLEDLELFLEWRTPGISEEGKEEFRAAWREVLPLAHQVPKSLLLRDYHAANLMLLAEREGIRQAGLLDFQDAYQGPVTYDLVSLLEDARRDLPQGLRERMLARYLGWFPGLERAAFETSLAILAALRHTRVLAIFERLSRRDGRPDYQQLHSPRVERMLQRALDHPLLARLKAWMKRYAAQD
jgi:aminoglycoside/choline kinase family phosphotransferase